MHEIVFSLDCNLIELCSFRTGSQLLQFTELHPSKRGPGMTGQTWAGIGMSRYRYAGTDSNDYFAVAALIGASTDDEQSSFFLGVNFHRYIQ